MGEDKYTFINPYNFVPLVGEKHAVAEEKQNEELQSGVITYSLLTKTPLFIPDTSDVKVFQIDEEEHKSYEFFSYGESGVDGENEVKPVIPGSEIRGMLRSNFEILTNSCMSVVDSEKVINRRSCHVFKPGLIRKNENGTYDLLAAKDCIWRTLGEHSDTDERNWKKEYGKERRCYIQKGFEEGQKVYFSYNERKLERGECKPLATNVSRESGEVEGYMIKGEASPVPTDKPENEKHCCHIFTLEHAGSRISVNISIEVLEQCLAEYKKNKERVQDEYSYKEYGEQLKKFKAQKGSGYFPVYYSQVEQGHVMLSPASVTKEIYKHQMKNIIGGFGSCESEPLCPACSLFGMVSETKAVSSRIRMSDLTCKSDEWFDGKPITLPELSSPKVGNVEFYLKRPEDAIFWTYDYYINSNGEVQAWDTPIINGRKFYWHQPEMKLPVHVKQNGRNMTIHPVKKDTLFQGKLYFDHITKTELAQLLWLLNCGEKGEMGSKLHAYKLGAGKPLGLGSVALNVDEVKIREVVKGEGRISLKEEPLKNKGQDLWSDACFDEEIQEKVLPMFRKMSKFELLEGKKVSYPMTVSQMEKSDAVEEGFEWFTENHYYYDSRRNMEIGMGTDRKQMRFREYMEAMEPELKAVTGNAAVGREGECVCVWVAKYRLNGARIQELKDLLDTPMYIEQKTGDWIQMSDVAVLAEQYQVLALPSGTRDFMIREAKEHFERVYMATKSAGSRYDDGWTEC